MSNFICQLSERYGYDELPYFFASDVVFVDFCLWAPPTPDQTIGDTEGSEVSWCTKHGHGGRLVPDGAITGVQYLKTPDYVQVVGFINQSMIDIAGDDFGGELDPHGDDFVSKVVLQNLHPWLHIVLCSVEIPWVD